MVLIFHIQLQSPFIFNKIIYSVKIGKYGKVDYGMKVITWNYQRTSPDYIYYIINKNTKCAMMLNSTHATSLTSQISFCQL